MFTPRTETAYIKANNELASGLFLMKIETPTISQRVLPGQFVHVKIPHIEAHILRRPFSVYACDAEQKTIDILYQVVGVASKHITTLRVGDSLDLLGPVGSSWNTELKPKKALLMAGGVGAAPLFMLTEILLQQNCAVDIILGAQKKEALVCLERYQNLIESSPNLHASLACATDDGSFGRKGFCTTLLEEALFDGAYDYAAVCGPEIMIKRAVELIAPTKMLCEVSLERRMACGIGACLSCVVETSEGKKRACVDGPIFDARKVVFS